MLDWPRLLDRNKIQYWLGSGSNIEIACVWCGSSDPSHHLSISLEGKGFFCWRNASHSGKNPVRLLMALLKCTQADAELLAGRKSHEILAFDNFSNTVSNLFTGRTESVVHTTLKFPHDFVPILNRGSSKLAFKYLLRRGYNEREVHEIVEKYDLRTTYSGSFHHRIIVPIRFDSVVGWTGRAISDRAELRYFSLPTSIEKAKKLGVPPAIVPIESCILNYGKLRKTHGRKLLIGEGPFDGIRLDYFGEEYECYGTCLFGKQLHDGQIGLLENIRNNFDDMIFLIDRDAQLDSLKLSSRISHLAPRFMYLDQGIKDPALLTRTQAKILFR